MSVCVHFPQLHSYPSCSAVLYLFEYWSDRLRLAALHCSTKTGGWSTSSLVSDLGWGDIPTLPNFNSVCLPQDSNFTFPAVPEDESTQSLHYYPSILKWPDKAPIFAALSFSMVQAVLKIFPPPTSVSMPSMQCSRASSNTFERLHEQARESWSFWCTFQLSQSTRY